MVTNWHSWLEILIPIDQVLGCRNAKYLYIPQNMTWITVAEWYITKLWILISIGSAYDYRLFYSAPSSYLNLWSYCKLHNLNEILIAIQIICVKKIHLKISPGKRPTFCSAFFNVTLNLVSTSIDFILEAHLTLNLVSTSIDFILEAHLYALCDQWSVWLSTSHVQTHVS